MGIDVGIDFTSRLIAIALFHAHGKTQLIPDRRDAQELVTPTAICLSREAAFVGRAAFDVLSEVSPNFYFDSQSLLTDEAFACRTAPSGAAWPRECLIALLMKKIWRDLRAHSNDEVESLAVGVPPGLSARAQQALIEAACLAGFPEPLLVEEAILASNIATPNKSPSGLDVVCRLEHDQFVATVVQYEPGSMSIVSSIANPACCGVRLYEELLRSIRQQHWAQFGKIANLNTANEVRIVEQLRLLRKRLESGPDQAIQAGLEIDHEIVEMVLLHADLQSAAAVAYNEIGCTIDEALSAAKIEADQVTRCLMLGENAAIFAKSVTASQELELLRDRLMVIHDRSAIAFGLAKTAADTRAGVSSQSLHLPKRTPGLGVRTIDTATGKHEIQLLIPPLHTIPSQHIVTYFTNRHGQQRLILDLVQLPADREPIPLGVIQFQFEPMNKNVPIQVAMGYDASGRIQITAVNQTTGQKVRASVQHQLTTSELIPSEWQQLIADTPLCS